VSFFAIPDAVRLDNPKLMLWRELQQHGDEALHKSNKRWLVLGLRPKDHDSRMGFWRVCLDIREIQVQRHQHAIFCAAHGLVYIGDTLNDNAICGNAGPRPDQNDVANTQFRKWDLFRIGTRTRSAVSGSRAASALSARRDWKTARIWSQ
jgi:hypothetical protein